LIGACGRWPFKSVLWHVPLETESSCIPARTPRTTSKLHRYGDCDDYTNQVSCVPDTSAYSSRNEGLGYQQTLEILVDTVVTCRRHHRHCSYSVGMVDASAVDAVDIVDTLQNSRTASQTQSRMSLHTLISTVYIKLQTSRTNKAVAPCTGEAAGAR
jgi:hypothetical protein